MQGNSVASATQVNTAVQETARQQMANQRNPLNFDHVTQSVVNPNQMDSSVNSMLNQVPVETTSKHIGGLEYVDILYKLVKYNFCCLWKH